MPDRTRLWSDVSPFRLSARDAQPPPVPDLGPATRHARPVAIGHPIGPAGRADLPTDPHGFPPIPAASVRHPLRPPVTPPPDALEAAALAAAFAADYLSWDEDDPERRGRVLAAYLAVPVGDPARLGWAGAGRQRAEFTLPGPVRPGGEGRVLVDVRVRVTPYRSVGDRRAERLLDAAEPEQDVPGVPAAAPAPTGRGWRGLASYWIRLSVPVVGEGDRLVVDPGEEDGPPPGVDVRALRDGPEPPAEDDPLPELAAPAPGGAW